MEEIINHQLFNRIQDNNWDTICQICCGLKKFEDIPEEHKRFFESLRTFIVSNEENNAIESLRQYFSIAIDCYKTREEAIIKVLIAVSSIIDLEVKWNNNKIINLFNEDLEVRLQLKVLVFNCIIELLSNNYRHLALNTTLDFSSFIGVLLENYGSIRKDFVKCFHLILTVDHQVIGDEQNLRQIIIKCIPNDKDSEKLISLKNNFFCTLFEVYFKLRKALKIHEIMIEITNSLNSNLSLNQQFVRLYGKCILQLPFGQLIDLWKLLLDKFSASNIFLVNLLTYFLAHIRYLDDNIPLHLKTQINQLFNNTKECLKKTEDSLTLNDEILTENLLNFYFAWSSTMILQMVYNQNSTIDEISAIIKPNQWWDMSLMFDFTTEKTWKTLFTNCSKTRSTLQQIMVELLIQKIEYFKSFELNFDLSQDQRKLIETSISEISSQLMKNFAANISLLASHQISLIITQSSIDNLCQLSDSMVSNIIENEEKQSFKIEKFLVNSNVWESTEFQTAFIGSFTKQISAMTTKRKRKIDEELPKLDSIISSLISSDSIWFKYATDTPNSAKLNKMWSVIASASSQIEDIEQKHISDKNMSKMTELVKIVSRCVPLEYLLPGNQMRCLLCLSSLLFSIDFSEERYQLLLKYILDSILRIFDGVRSIWLFNFVNPANYIIKTLKALNDFSDRGKSRILISSLIESLLRNTKSSALHVEELENKLIENEDKLSFEIVLMSETILLKRCLQILNKKSIPRNLIQLKESCGPLSHKLSNTIHNRIKKCLINAADFESLDSVQIVESFAVVFEFLVSKSSDEESIHLKTKWRKLLAKLIDISINQMTTESVNESCVNFLSLLCLHRQKLANILPEDFIINLWHVLCPAVDETEITNPYLIPDDCDIFDVISRKEKSKDLLESIRSKRDENRRVLVESISLQNSYNHKIKPLVIELIKCSSSEEFDKLINRLISDFRSNDYVIVSHLCSLWSAIFQSDFHLTEEKNKVFQKVINDLLTITVNHCQRCNQTNDIETPEIQLFIKVALLKIVCSVTHITKNLIKGPQLFLSYSACIEANLNQFLSDPDIFIALFQNVYHILNEVLLQHKYIAISSMSTFNLIVQNLLKFLMIVSEEERFIAYNTTVQHDLELCSKNMDRLLTLMAALQTDYCSHAPHLIASYVTQTQSVSVHQTVRKNLLSAIYRVLKVITNKDSIEMIHCRLNEANRQIFHNIYANYEKYYKFKGQI